MTDTYIPPDPCFLCSADGPVLLKVTAPQPTWVCGVCFLKMAEGT